MNDDLSCDSSGKDWHKTDREDQFDCLDRLRLYKIKPSTERLTYKTIIYNWTTIEVCHVLY